MRRYAALINAARSVVAHHWHSNLQGEEGARRIRVLSEALADLRPPEPDATHDDVISHGDVITFDALVCPRCGGTMGDDRHDNLGDGESVLCMGEPKGERTVGASE